MSRKHPAAISRRTILKGAAGTAAAFAVPSFFVRESQAATQTLRIGIIPAYAFGIYWLVQDQGFAPGVNMEFSVFPSGPPAIEAMVGGSVDAITVGSVPPLAAMHRKVADFREISICGDASGLFTIYGAPDVKSLADLEGRKIAVTSGTNFDFFLDVVLSNNGLQDMPMTRVNMEPIDGQAALIAGAVDATVPLATSRKLIQDRMPDSNIIADGSKIPLESRPSIMDVFMTTQPMLDANEAAFVEVVAAFHEKGVGMLRNDNAGVVARMVEWQAGLGRASVTPEDVEPLLNGYFYFDTREIKDVYARGILTNALRVQSEFLVANDRIGGMPDLDALVSDQIVRQIQRGCASDRHGPTWPDMARHGPTWHGAPFPGARASRPLEQSRAFGPLRAGRPRDLMEDEGYPEEQLDRPGLAGAAFAA